MASWRKGEGLRRGAAEPPAPLGLRRRSVHDLRRTDITLARGDGANRDIRRADA